MSIKRLPITGLVIGTVSTAVLVCGDPDRAVKITNFMHDVSTLSKQREYHAYQGHYGGKSITVCSHGVGAPGAAIAFEELIAAGGRQLIRVGTCGGMQADIHSGDLVIATAAVQHTGYGRETVPVGYPAIADFQLTHYLQQVAAERNHPYHCGLVLTRDNFYGGVDTPNTPDYAILSAANVMAVEMECAALFIVGSLRGVQTAAILAVDGNVLQTEESMESYQPHREVVTTAVEVEIKIALETLKQMNA